MDIYNYIIYIKVQQGSYAKRDQVGEIDSMQFVTHNEATRIALGRD